MELKDVHVDAKVCKSMHSVFILSISMNFLKVLPMGVTAAKVLSFQVYGFETFPYCNLCQVISLYSHQIPSLKCLLPNCSQTQAQLA